LLLFFNSYSRVLASGWLAKLYSAAERLSPGALVERQAAGKGRRAYGVPNVAIRTNAFLIERFRFLSFTQPLDTNATATISKRDRTA